jgi:hypothetical protein
MTRDQDIYGQHLRKVVEHVRQLPASEQRSAVVRERKSAAKRSTAGNATGRPMKQRDRTK